MKKKQILIGVGCLGLALASTARAADVVFTFQEHDSPANTSTLLGTTSTFTESGLSITASGFALPSTASALFAKFTFGDSGETGLGMADDPSGDTEINSLNFIQLDLSKVKNTTSAILTISSIQGSLGEGAKVLASTTSGSLGTVVIATLPGTAGTVQSVDITSFVNAGDFIDVTATSGNVLIETLAVAPPPPPSQPLAPGDTATIGFWNNKNGQAVIDSLNGGPNSTALGNWLAVNFGCLFGDLNGQNNTTVAAAFQGFFNLQGLGKTYAQIMSAALASYVTDSTLAGTNPLVVKYGFNVSVGGTGDKTYNVGLNGTAIGLANNGTYTVMQLLEAANANCSGGILNPNAVVALNNIFDGINQGGDIQ